MRKSNEQFVKEVQDLVGNSYIPLTKYQTSKIKVFFYHVDCGRVFEMRPNCFLSKGQRCPKCSKMRMGIKQSLTQAEFDRRIAKLNHGRYRVLSKYTTSASKVKVKCLKCGNIFYAPAHNLMKGSGCPYCMPSAKLTNEEFKRRVAQKNNGQFTFLEPYINTETKILCKCNKCGYEWKTSPHAFFNTKGCPRCQTNHVYTTDEFKWKLKRVFDDEYELVGDYKPNKKLMFKHNKCGHTFIARPADLLRDNDGCSYCNRSKGERRIENILRHNHVEFIPQYKFVDCKYKRHLPFDFYLPHMGIAIEYDGSQHTQINHFRRTKEIFDEAHLRDQVKTWYCRSHSIQLIRIPYKVKTVKQIKQYLYFL